MVFERTQDLKR